jgi:hypothetical protein
MAGFVLLQIHNEKHRASISQTSPPLVRAEAVPQLPATSWRMAAGGTGQLLEMATC